MDLNKFLEFINTNGVSSLAIIGLAYVCIRLFGKEKGILTKISENHIEFIHNLADSQKDHIAHEKTSNECMLAINVEMIELKREMKSLMEEHFNPDSRFATVRLHKYGLHACDVLSTICKEMSLQETTEPLIEKMRHSIGTTL